MRKIIRLLVLLLLFAPLSGCSQAVLASVDSKTQQIQQLKKTSSSLKQKLAAKKYQSASLKSKWQSDKNAQQPEAVSASGQSSSSAVSTSSSSSSADQITTGQGQIVGNRNSHIYHVPGQAGYKMNAANAVYFSTEAQAQAAGYRKALR
ncbi:hypothetical protein [Liquorilactobacillus sicerae]|uniref:sunset domain-containing protein n=1 Tax=Liquorilactobacillus sicerae TaxID=1416943 RepID=UPI0031F395E0